MSLMLRNLTGFDLITSATTTALTQKARKLKGGMSDIFETMRIQDHFYVSEEGTGCRTNDFKLLSERYPFSDYLNELATFFSNTSNAVLNKRFEDSGLQKREVPPVETTQPLLSLLLQRCGNYDLYAGVVRNKVFNGQPPGTKGRASVSITVGKMIAHDVMRRKNIARIQRSR
jgi:hypothetical protein